MDTDAREVRKLLRKELQQELGFEGPNLSPSDIEKFGLQKDATLDLILDELRLHTELLRTLVENKASKV